MSLPPCQKDNRIPEEFSERDARSSSTTGRSIACGAYPSFDAPFAGQDEVVLALDKIRADSSEGYGIVENIISRMVLGRLHFCPVQRCFEKNHPWINDHLQTVVIPPSLPFAYYGSLNRLAGGACLQGQRWSAFMDYFLRSSSTAALFRCRRLSETPSSTNP